MALPNKQQMEMVAVALEMERERGFASGGKDKLKTLIAQGWRTTYAELFGQNFVDSLDSAETDDRHHSEAIEWHWNARTALLEGGRPPNDEFAYFPIWARGNLKTTIAEALVCTDAILSFAYNQPGFCLYIGREKDKIKENIGNIETLFGSPQVRKCAPQLSQVKKDEDTNQQGRWTASLFQTQSNYSVKGATVESAQAGSKMKQTRVTFFVPDDIDSRDESPVEAETKYKKLTSEILPMRQANTLTFFAQNLINRFSTMYRIYKGQSKALANRKMTKPIPAVRDLVIEQRTMSDGKIKDVVVSGKPTWRVWNLQRVQDEIDTMELPVFLTEMQHEVEQSKTGLMHKKYDDNVHPVSYSQFAAVYGSRDAWKQWYKVPASDWARTKTKYHANVAGYFCVSSQNTSLPGFTFLIPFSFKADTSPADVAVRLLSALTPFAYESKTWEMLVDEAWKRTNAHEHFTTESERTEFTKNYYTRLIFPYAKRVLDAHNVKRGANSHSEDKVRMMLNNSFGFDFIPSNPRENDALEDIDQAMRVDITLPHCFDQTKKGYSRFAVLCKDDLSATPQTINDRLVYPPVPYPEVITPDDLHDDDLFRYQMMNRRFAPPSLSKTGEKIDVAEKLNDDFGQCLVADSLITTSKGDIPICDVKVGDLVVTRKGYRKVIASEMTQKSAPVYDLILSNGRVLQGTANHPIYIQNRGFIPLQMVEKGDVLLGICQTIKQNQNPRELSIKELLFTVTPKQNSNHIGDIIYRISVIGKKVSVICTLKFGKMQTAIFQQALKFTTLTETMTTTTCLTLNSSQNLNTRDFTPIKLSVHRNDLPDSEKSNRFRIYHGGRQKEENGLVKRKLKWLWNAMLIREPLPVNVNSAEKNTKQNLTQVNSVEAIALNAPETVSQNVSTLAKLFKRIALSVIKNLMPLGVIKNSAPKIAAIGTQRSDVASVFNLEVEDMPEYFANGVLVHNCMQMVYFKNLLANIELTTDESYGEYLRSAAPELLPENIAKILSPEEQSIAIASEQYNRYLWDEQEAKADYISDPYNDWLRAKEDAGDDFGWR